MSLLARFVDQKKLNMKISDLTRDKSNLFNIVEKEVDEKLKSQFKTHTEYLEFVAGCDSEIKEIKNRLFNTYLAKIEARRSNLMTLLLD